MSQIDGDLDHEVIATPSIRAMRNAALWQDVLLFTCAFTAGAAVYGALRSIVALATDRTDDFWTIGLSEDLVFAGLVAGELFVLWNNGIRQGIRGHSIAKHRMGLAVVDRDTGRPTGALRGLVRGLVVVVLVDLSAAALPVGLPTVLRRATPDSWHLGFATYLALALLLVPLVLAMDRRIADRIAGTKVVETADRTSVGRGRVVAGLEAIGVIGVLGLAVAYIAFYSPLLRFPGFL